MGYDEFVVFDEGFYKCFYFGFCKVNWVNNVVYFKGFDEERFVGVFYLVFKGRVYYDCINIYWEFWNVCVYEFDFVFDVEWVCVFMGDFKCFFVFFDGIDIFSV